MIAVKRSACRNPNAPRAGHRYAASQVTGIEDMPVADDDALRLFGEITALRKKRLRIGVAVVRGDIDGTLCAEVRKTVGKLADYISYAKWGPLLVVAFQRGLFEQLKPLWRELLAGSPGVRAGVAFPDDGANTRDLLLAARLALARATALQCDLVAFDEEESAAAANGHRALPEVAPLHAERGGRVCGPLRAGVRM